QEHRALLHRGPLRGGPARLRGRGRRDLPRAGARDRAQAPEGARDEEGRRRPRERRLSSTRALVSIAAVAVLASPVAPAAERRAAPHIVAVVPGPELESAVLLGRSGQIYEPNGEGGWRRRERGGVGCAVQAAMRLGGDLWAVCSRAPLFRHSG